MEFNLQKRQRSVWCGFEKNLTFNATSTVINEIRKDAMKRHSKKPNLFQQIFLFYASLNKT